MKNRRIPINPIINNTINSNGWNDWYASLPKPKATYSAQSTPGIIGSENFIAASKPLSAYISDSQLIHYSSKGYFHVNYRTKGKSVRPQETMRIDKNQKNEVMKFKPNMMELFAGIGGGSAAVEQVIGLDDFPFYKVVLASEINEDAQKVFAANFEDVPLYGDIRLLLKKGIMLPKIHLVVAGFPCNSFSSAGDKKGFDSASGELFFRIPEILTATDADVVLLENVPGILVNENEIITTLANVGYQCVTKCLYSEDFGVPQTRERWYLVGVKKTSDFAKNVIDYNNKMTFTFPTSRKSLDSTHILYDALEHDDEILAAPENINNILCHHYRLLIDDVEKKSGKTEFFPIGETREICTKIKKDKKSESTTYDIFTTFKEGKTQIGLREKNNTSEPNSNSIRFKQSIYPLIDVTSPSPTLVQSLVHIAQLNRKLNSNELRNIQAFPQDFKIPENTLTNNQLLFANSFSVPVIRAILAEIARQIFGAEVNELKLEKEMPARKKIRNFDNSLGLEFKKHIMLEMEGFIPVTVSLDKARSDAEIKLNEKMTTPTYIKNTGSDKIISAKKRSAFTKVLFNRLWNRAALAKDQSNIQVMNELFYETRLIDIYQSKEKIEAHLKLLDEQFKAQIVQSQKTNTDANIEIKAEYINDLDETVIENQEVQILKNNHPDDTKACSYFHFVSVVNENLYAKNIPKEVKTGDIQQFYHNNKTYYYYKSADGNCRVVYQKFAINPHFKQIRYSKDFFNNGNFKRLSDSTLAYSHLEEGIPILQIKKLKAFYFVGYNKRRKTYYLVNLPDSINADEIKSFKQDKNIFYYFNCEDGTCKVVFQESKFNRLFSKKTFFNNNDFRLSEGDSPTLNYKETINGVPVFDSDECILFCLVGYTPIRGYFSLKIPASIKRDDIKSFNWPSNQTRYYLHCEDETYKVVYLQSSFSRLRKKEKIFNNGNYNIASDGTITYTNIDIEHGVPIIIANNSKRKINNNSSIKEDASKNKIVKKNPDYFLVNYNHLTKEYALEKIIGDVKSDILSFLRYNFTYYYLKSNIGYDVVFEEKIFNEIENKQGFFDSDNYTILENGRLMYKNVKKMYLSFLIRKELIHTYVMMMKQKNVL